MRNILFIIGALFASTMFSQTTESSLKQASFKTNIEENHFLKKSKSSIILEMFDKVIPVETTKDESNFENKFSMNDLFEKKFTKAYIKSINKKSTTITSTVSSDFVNAVITKIMIERNINIDGIQNEAFAYGDRNIDLYRDYPSNIDLINSSYSLNSNLKIELGNNIYKDLNKILKTELDKTLQNSLNLLTVNF